MVLIYFLLVCDARRVAEYDLCDLPVQSYASILYLRVPDSFQMILRGKEIEHHNIVTDMMLKKEVTYRPVLTNGLPKDSNVVTITSSYFFLSPDDVSLAYYSPNFYLLCPDGS
jgi:hypothetical protein